ncbi:MAG TPA: PVC-type heme-binding CxxCH protein [Pirellulales bacterium]|nr:PVC-type heme-binding CxxCH protein [Pirellulales bacterium]
MRSLFALLAAVAIMPSWILAQDTPPAPEEAARRITVPEGFRVTLFAGEPDVVQPIAMTFDDRGRLWVVECLSYPHWNEDPKTTSGDDRVVIFSDHDGDGRFDERKVFWDQGKNLSGIELGFGGVWLCSTPKLVFVPDADADDVPDGPPRVVLDGWDVKAKHNVFNSLAWGPDGWLYGLNGILSNSRVAKPGTPDDQRTAINCGVWRFHPTRGTFEVVAHGTTNPWGIDFDEYGQLFITNCVIHHLWHVVPGAHFERMFGQDIDPHTYGLMASCADHIHWGGGDWTTSRGGKGTHDQPGGGHAHSGAMVYLGDNWPDEYRNDVFTCNLHGSRVNRDLLESKGSGYVAHHGKDFLFSGDPWYRGLVVKYGPDGGVYVCDWSDTGECHNYEVAHTTSGRIFKITYDRPKPYTGDLAERSDAELVALQLHKNDWLVSHARRILQERAAAGKLATGTRDALAEMFVEQPEVTRKLRALWALHVTGEFEDLSKALVLYATGDEWVRAWAVRLTLEGPTQGDWVRESLLDLAVSDSSPVVRLALASGLQRLPPAERWPLAEALAVHGEDASDANLPLMIWYGVEPLVMADPPRALKLAQSAELPLIRQYIARRLSDGIPAEIERQSPQALAPLVAALGEAANADAQLDLLHGTLEAIEGRRRVLAPPEWPGVYARLARSPMADVRDQATLLSLIFGDAQTYGVLRRTIMDAATGLADRQKALDALVRQKDRELAPLLEKLIEEPAMRGHAVRGLATYGDDDAPEVILRHYDSFDPAERADAVLTLASRPAFALALLNAVAEERVPRSDLSAFTVRQLAGMKDDTVRAKLAEVWGEVRPTSQDKAALIGKFKPLLAADKLTVADRSQGRLLFTRHCAACHKLFGEGQTVGPELTGSQRANVDYLLENLVDPNALVGRDYQMTIIQTTDGRVINGIILREDADVIAVQTQNERLLLQANEIEARERSKVSLMPEGLLDKLSETELRALIAYVAGPEQVPLPEK